MTSLVIGALGASLPSSRLVFLLRADRGISRRYAKQQGDTRAVLSAAIGRICRLFQTPPLLGKSLRCHEVILPPCSFRLPFALVCLRPGQQTAGSLPPCLSFPAPRRRCSVVPAGRPCPAAEHRRFVQRRKARHAWAGIHPHYFDLPQID